MIAPPALALEHIAIHFGPVRALEDASLELRRGAVHALLGENGAGKTTLMRIAFGLLSPDAGTIRVDGAPVVFRSPLDALRRGIGMVHQHFTSVPAMTVAENVALGGRGRYRLADARVRVLTVGRAAGIDLDPDARAGDLSVAAQQRLEIVKALARGARTLILDEPTAVLAPSESEELLQRLRQLASRGDAVLIITHKLKEALSVADDVTVLHRGRSVLTRAAADVSADELAHAMLGATPQAAPPRAQRAPGPPVITATALSVVDTRGVIRVRDVTFDARAGEIVGIVGVEGAGQHELLRAIAGRTPPAGGTLHIPARIGFVPEDRQRDGLVLPFTLVENIALRDAGAARGLLPWRAIAARTTSLVAQYAVRAQHVTMPAAALSGGNQQKLVLARELEGDPDALIVENPTRGLDIAATAAIHARLLAARDAGCAIVLYSGDLDEVLQLADRVLVMYAGRCREMAPARAAVGRAMLGLE